MRFRRWTGHWADDLLRWPNGRRINANLMPPGSNCLTKREEMLTNVAVRRSPGSVTHIRRRWRSRPRGHGTGPPEACGGRLRDAKGPIDGLCSTGKLTRTFSQTTSTDQPSGISLIGHRRSSSERCCRQAPPRSARRSMSAWAIHPSHEGLSTIPRRAARRLAAGDEGGLPGTPAPRTPTHRLFIANDENRWE